MNIILSLNNISKRYGELEVLSSVNMDLKAGEIHGLVGENGAGKSTLLAILFGITAIEETGGHSGEIWFGRERAVIETCSQAVKLGIGMVHQEFALIPQMTVTENIKIGREKVVAVTSRFLGENLSLIDRKANTGDAKQILNKLGLNIDPGLQVFDLSVNTRQFIEVAREIGKDDLRVLILDEPTAVLSREDAGKLLTAVKEIADRGTGVIFVSHRLEETMAVCDRITVLRDGQVAAVHSREEFNREKIIQDMVGGTVTETRRRNRTASEKVIMSFEQFRVDMPGEVLKCLNLKVFEGEILGITGLSGHGKLAVGNGLMGMYPSCGRIVLDGDEINPSQIGDVMSRGIYYLPEDRRNAGLLLKRSLADNIIFTAVQRNNRFLRPFFCKALSLIDRKKAGNYAMDCIRSLDIKCHSVHQKVYQLSGGNQQKVCLARTLAAQPRVLFVAEPTRGVDIGAKEKILKALIETCEDSGTTVVLISSELGELRRVCDRIAVVYEGCLSAVLPPDAGDAEFARAFCGEAVNSLSDENRTDGSCKEHISMEAGVCER